MNKLTRSLGLCDRDLDLFMAGVNAGKHYTWKHFAEKSTGPIRQSHRDLADRFADRAVYYLTHAGCLPPSPGAADRLDPFAGDGGAARSSESLSPEDPLPEFLRSLAMMPWRPS